MLYVLAVLLAVFQILDGYLTEKVIQHGGREGNPVAKFLMRPFGRVGFYVIKGLVVSAAVFAAAYYAITAVVVLSLIFYGWVVIHNFNVYERLRALGR